MGASTVGGRSREYKWSNHTLICYVIGLTRTGERTFGWKGSVAQGQRIILFSNLLSKKKDVAYLAP